MFYSLRIYNFEVVVSHTFTILYIFCRFDLTIPTGGLMSENRNIYVEYKYKCVCALTLLQSQENIHLTGCS
jgi:hypothetical protein